MQLLIKDDKPTAYEGVNTQPLCRLKAILNISHPAYLYLDPSESMQMKRNPPLTYQGPLTKRDTSLENQVRQCLHFRTPLAFEANRVHTPCKDKREGAARSKLCLKPEAILPMKTRVYQIFLREVIGCKYARGLIRKSKPLLMSRPIQKLFLKMK